MDHDYKKCRRIRWKDHLFNSNWNNRTCFFFWICSETCFKFPIICQWVYVCVIHTWIKYILMFMLENCTVVVITPYTSLIIIYVRCAILDRRRQRTATTRWLGAMMKMCFFFYFISIFEERQFCRTDNLSTRT